MLRLPTNNTKSVLLGLIITACLGATLSHAAVFVQFNPANPAVGPFPSDFLTVPDSNQKTGIRVNMPLPDCKAQPSSCFELGLVNNFDGFNIDPRFTVKFSSRVDVNTLKAGIFFVALENKTNDEIGVNRIGQVIKINKIFYDPLTDTVWGKPDDAMDQHRRYALVVTDAVKEANGDPVLPDPAYSTCTVTPAGSYCQQLAQMVASFGSGTFPGKIVSATMFTTLSATSFMERARDAVAGVRPTITRLAKIFNFQDIASWQFRAHNRVNPVGFVDTILPTKDIYGIGRIGFGTFTSPEFRDDKGFIADPPTLAPVTVPTKANEISFQIFYPVFAPPPGGYPVVVVGHGFGDHRLGMPLALAPQLNALGFAVIASTFVGYGSGPLGQVVIREKNGTVTTMLSGGRSTDTDGNGVIDDFEGCPVKGALRTRDCIRQSAFDTMSLIRGIRNGIDLDADGKVDLDSKQMYFVGHTAGGVYGSIVLSLEPDVIAGAYQEVGSPVYDMLRQSSVLTPLLTDVVLAGHTPSLLNKGAGFDENYVYRDTPPKVNDVPGAVELQNFFELAEWITMPSDPAAWATHMTASPLPGRPIKPMLYQMAWGDETIPNPSVSGLIRTANGLENTRYYRNDFARAIFPYFRKDPVAFSAYLDTDPEKAVAVAAANMIGYFFITGGKVIYEGNDLMQTVFRANIWEKPFSLTETSNYIP